LLERWRRLSPGVIAQASLRVRWNAHRV